MDNSFGMFQDRIVAAIRAGDVFCLFFPRLGKTLIVDMRSTIEVPPAVIVDDMVANPEERRRSLERLRPQLPPPRELHLAPWFGFVRSLPETTVYEALIERCVASGGNEFAERCRAAIDELRRIEQRAIRAIVRGDLSRVVWQRPRDEPRN